MSGCSRQRGAAPRGGPRGAIGWTLFAVAVFAGGGCGPSDAEAGVAVALASPLVLLVEMALFALLRQLWSRSGAGPFPSPLQGWVVLLAVLVAYGALASFAGPFSAAAEWVLAAVWAFGTSHLALALVIWRIWLAVRPRDAFVGGPALAFAILAAPALPLAAGWVPEGDGEPIVALWVVIGYLGWVPGGLYLLALVEAAVRAGKAADRKPAAPTTGGPA